MNTSDTSTSTSKSEYKVSMSVRKRPDRIFSGDYSRDMWNAINGAKTKSDLRDALYFVCCRLQELEEKIAHGSGVDRK